MTQLALKLEDWKSLRPDGENAARAAFRFTLRPAESDPGVAPAGETFWTEVRLSRDLAARTGWNELDPESLLKAMYLFAVDRIVQAGAPLREAPLFWRPGSHEESIPPPYLERVPFLPAAPVIFEVETASSHSARQARKAAGLA